MNKGNFIKDLQSILKDTKIWADVNFFGDSCSVVIPVDVELTTLIIVIFANFAKNYKCTFNVSYYCNKLTFSFRF